MAVVAGLFDSDANATEAMDKLLRAGFKDLETRVVEPGTYTGEGSGVVSIIPNTAGSGTGMPGGVVPAAMGGTGRVDWLDEMDEVDRAFYLEGLKEGANLALVHVHDEDVQQVRALLRSYGARTHVKD